MGQVSVRWIFLKEERCRKYITKGTDLETQESKWYFGFSSHDEVLSTGSGKTKLEHFNNSVLNIIVFYKIFLANFNETKERGIYLDKKE